LVAKNNSYNELVNKYNKLESDYETVVQEASKHKTLVPVENTANSNQNKEKPNIHDNGDNKDNKADLEDKELSTTEALASVNRFRKAHGAKPLE